MKDDKFEGLVDRIMPIRKHFLEITEEQGNAEVEAILANTNPNCKLLLKDIDDGYWAQVIEEADRRIMAN